MHYYKIDVVTDSKEKFHFFNGSMIRGALGYALKEEVCINPSQKCEGCFHASSCLFYQFYELKNSIHPYRLAMGVGEEGLNFSLYLYTASHQSLLEVLRAIKTALEVQGLTKERKKVVINTLLVNGTQVKDLSKLSNISAKNFQINTFCKNITLQFLTPLRMKQNNQIVQKDVALHTLVNSAYQRLLALEGKKMQKLNYRVEGKIVKDNMKFIQVSRYSARQKKSMNFDGLMGSVTIEGIDAKSYEYLKVGEIIGVGKQCVFGLGSYKIKECE